MARTFAGALGLIAWITTLALGWMSGGGIDEVLFRAWLCLMVFTMIGFLAGLAAGWIVDEAVRDRVGAELTAAEAAKKAAEATKAG